MQCADYSRRARGHTSAVDGRQGRPQRPVSRAWRGPAPGALVQGPRAAAIALALGVLLASAPASTRAADSPGVTLRLYLDARWRGDVVAAQALWDPDDLRRTEAMGTHYPDLEARFDDNLLWSAADRTATQTRRPALCDSSVEAAWARYTVAVPAAAGTD